MQDNEVPEWQYADETTCEACLATLVQAKLNIRQLDTSARHTERTSGCCFWTVGSAPSSAASRF